MDLKHTDPAVMTGRYTHPAVRGLAVASVSLGFFSSVVFWWYPFGMMLASVGLTLGLISLAIGNRGGFKGENLARVGTLLCSSALTVILTITRSLRFLMWDH